MVLQNYINLEDGIPARLHFVSHRFGTQAITDPETGEAKGVNALVFTVDRLNDSPVNATFSIIQEKLAQMLQPFLENDRYRQVDFIITRRGRGRLASWSVQHIQRG